jgi:hypothetical protein
MKKISLAIMSLFLIFSIGGCKKGELGTVSFDQSQSVDFVIPHNSVLALPNIITPAVSTNWSANFSNHNTDKDHLRELKLKTLTLNITGPAGKTWGFMKSIDIYIQADGLSETKIAYNEDIPDNSGQSISLNTVDVDLTPYAKKDNFTLRVQSTTRELNPDDVDVRADMVFGVTANLLN